MDRFGGAPASITQLGQLLKQISLEELSSNGFMIVVKEGDILIVPEGYLFIEACLGDVACDTVTYNFLLKTNVSSWKQEGGRFYFSSPKLFNFIMKPFLKQVRSYPFTFKLDCRLMFMFHQKKPGRCTLQPNISSFRLTVPSWNMSTNSYKHVWLLQKSSCYYPPQINKVESNSNHKRSSMKIQNQEEMFKTFAPLALLQLTPLTPLNVATPDLDLRRRQQQRLVKELGVLECLFHVFLTFSIIV